MVGSVVEKDAKLLRRRLAPLMQKGENVEVFLAWRVAEIGFEPFPTNSDYYLANLLDNWRQSEGRPRANTHPATPNAAERAFTHGDAGVAWEQKRRRKP